jgi:hypothetical protein
MRARKREYQIPLTVRDEDGAKMLGVGRDTYQKIKKQLDKVKLGDNIEAVTYASLERFVKSRTIPAE